MQFLSEIKGDKILLSLQNVSYQVKENGKVHQILKGITYDFDLGKN